MRVSVLNSQFSSSLVAYGPTNRSADVEPSLLSRVIVPNVRRRIQVLFAPLMRLFVLYSMTPLRLPKLAPLENYIVL